MIQKIRRAENVSSRESNKTNNPDCLRGGGGLGKTSGVGGATLQ